jgi:hypothetical protein
MKASEVVLKDVGVGENDAKTWIVRNVPLHV